MNNLKNSYSLKIKRIQSVLTPWRLTWYPRLLLCALAVGYIIAIFWGKGASTLTGRLGGDYPAFYGAGRIIAEGSMRDLYDSQRQIAAQKDLFPNKKNVFLPFPYPPFMAFAYYPLALLSYRFSYILHTLLMVGTLLLAMQLIRPMNRLFDQYFLCAFFFALVFYPMLRAVLGGQNIPITFLLVVIAWRAAIARHEWLAGMSLGLLLFKPQFALPLIVLYVLSRRWRIGVGSLFVALTLYGISVWMVGPSWLTKWLKYVLWHSLADAGINSANGVSWLGFLEAILGVRNPFALILTWVLILCTAVGLSLLWIQNEHRLDLTAKMGITVPFILLIPPHVMYYDMGLVLFTFAIVGTRNSARLLSIIGFTWMLCFSQVIASLMGFSPLFFILVFIGVLAICILGRQAVKPQAIL